MRRFIAIITSVVLWMCLISCSYKGTFDDGYVDGYNDGHYEGLCDGYNNGIEKAKQHIAFAVEDDLQSIARDIEDEYGIHPEDAMAVFFRYADGHDDVSEDELRKAIWAIRRYYYKSNDVINGIEDYWID